MYQIYEMWKEWLTYSTKRAKETQDSFSHKSIIFLSFLSFVRTDSWTRMVMCLSSQERRQGPLVTSALDISVQLSLSLSNSIFFFGEGRMMWFIVIF